MGTIEEKLDREAAKGIFSELNACMFRHDCRARWSSIDEVAAALEAFGAPPGETVHDRLRAWAERERVVREAADAVLSTSMGHVVMARQSVISSALRKLREALER